VELRVGEKVTIRLPGLGTSGYRWTAHVSGDAVTVALSPARDEPESRRPGAHVDEIAVIEGRRRGHATVTLEQRRSWENEPRPQDRRLLEVTVV